jgi:hypothetical protein
MAKFKNGVSINTHSGKKLKHLRIKAGKQRDVYVHDLVFKAKIIGRREAYMLEHPGELIPANDFYSFLDLTFETVDHDDNDSLNNDPENLKRMTRGDNTRKANRVNGERRRAKKAKKTERESVPF